MYLSGEDIPQLCDLVFLRAAVLHTLALPYFEAGEEMLVEAEESFHSGEEPLHPDLIDQLRLR